jgi:hypothetical protein
MQKCPEMPEGVKSGREIKKLFPTMEELEQKHSTEPNFLMVIF